MGKSFLSFAAAVILQALDNGYKYGFDIMDVTGLPSGTVYPALRRLEDNGYVFSSTPSRRKKLARRANTTS